jgi:flavorubredoxin
VNDDMTEIFQEINATDAIIIGQPNVDLYLNTINGVAQSLSRIGFEAGPKPLVGAGLREVDASH